jgi:hypothetical protein
MWPSIAGASLSPGVTLAHGAAWGALAGIVAGVAVVAGEGNCSAGGVGCAGGVCALAALAIPPATTSALINRREITRTGITSFSPGRHLI